MKVDEDRASGAALFERARDEARLNGHRGAGLGTQVSDHWDRPLFALGSNQDAEEPTISCNILHGTFP